MDETVKVIGSASMCSDGTLTLQLRASDESGALGDAQFIYSRTDSRYQEILKHIGGLKPGQSKAVPPWPEPESKLK